MDEYLHCIKTFRSQINDVEDQAAKISVEEQIHMTTIHTLESDIRSAKSQTEGIKLETEKMLKEKGQICSQILEKQRRIAKLESDSSTLSQTLELIQQERISLSAKLSEKSTYYNKVAEALNGTLKEQQGRDKIDKPTGDTEGKSGIESRLVMDNLGDEPKKKLLARLESAEAALSKISQMKLKLISENRKMKQSIGQVKAQINDFKPELREMDIEDMEEEHRALLSDKAGEAEYLQSLQAQSNKLKVISHMIKCACGAEYKVGLEPCE